MNMLGKLIFIGVISGTVLAVVLEIVQLLTNNPAAILLYNMDYIPLLKHWDHISGAGILFHFITCIVSVIVLYYLLKLFNLEKYGSYYVVVYTIGGGLLYFLSALTNTPPAYDMVSSWLYWTGGHALFGIVVGFLIKKWI